MFFGHQFVPLAKPKNTVDTTTSLRPRNGNVLVDYHNWLVNDTIHAHEQEWLQVWGWIAGRYKDYHHLTVEICEERGYGWCLWAHGDWADGFGTYGAKLKTSVPYPSITGKGR